MSKRLAKFQSTSRIQVDAELAAHWAFDAGNNGDVHIKNQIAQAKRTATILKKALTQFRNVRPEQELALKAAASAMTSLAVELAPMIPWAKAYKAFCLAEQSRENALDLENLAFDRWGNDIDAVQFEADLVQELSTNDGKMAFAQWLHSCNEHTDVPLGAISCCIEKLGDGPTVREKLAASVREERRMTDNRWQTREGERLIASFATYERYLAHRKAVAFKAFGILKSFT